MDQTSPFTKPSRGQRLRQQLQPKQAEPRAASLLALLQELDLADDSSSRQSSAFSLTDATPCYHDAFGESLQSPISGDLDSESRPTTPASSSQERIDPRSDVPSWVDTSRFRVLSSVLWGLTTQVMEALLEDRFELRRMAQAVLPLLAQVMRWFDLDCQRAVWAASLEASGAR